MGRPLDEVALQRRGQGKGAGGQGPPQRAHCSRQRLSAQLQSPPAYEPRQHWPGGTTPLCTGAPCRAPPTDSRRSHAESQRAFMSVKNKRKK